MNPNTAIAVSGINAAKLGLEASADNIANLQTPDFHRTLVQQSARPGGGVSATLVRDTEAGGDLTQDVVQQILSSYSFKANVLSLQIEQDTVGTLLSLVA